MHGEADDVMTRSELMRRRRQMHRRIREIVADRRLTTAQSGEPDRDADTDPPGSASS
jgi:hypothetical protein